MSGSTRPSCNGSVSKLAGCPCLPGRIAGDGSVSERLGDVGVSGRRSGDRTSAELAGRGRGRGDRDEGKEDKDEFHGVFSFDLLPPHLLQQNSLRLHRRKTMSWSQPIFQIARVRFSRAGFRLNFRRRMG